MNDTIIIFCAFSFMYRAQLWADSLGVPYSAQTICKRLLDCYGAEGDTSWKESMMISEQWKAVCCRTECVEQNWILFSSEVLTALRIRQFLGAFAQQQKASFPFIMSFCLTVCPQVSGPSHWMDLCEI